MSVNTYPIVARRGAFSDMSYIVECKSTYPFFETIAAFNVSRAAEAYMNECKKANPNYEYRIQYVK